MPKYEVSLEMVIHAPIKLIVEADSKQDAIDTASLEICSSVGDAIEHKNVGWKATVDVKVAKGVTVKDTTLKATTIYQASGGETAKKISD